MHFYTLAELGREKGGDAEGGGAGTIVAICIYVPPSAHILTDDVSMVGEPFPSPM